MNLVERMTKAEQAYQDAVAALERPGDYIREFRNDRGENEAYVKYEPETGMVEIVTRKGSLTIGTGLAGHIFEALRDLYGEEEAGNE